LGPERYLTDSEAGRFPARIKQLESNVDYVCVRDATTLELSEALKSLGGNSARLRSWLTLPVKENTAAGQLDQLIKARIEEVSGIGTGGWILNDPGDDYDLGQDFIRAL
jgi:hypothetical protein